MMKVLAFDTSSKALSVAVLNNMECLATVTINIKKNHSINLMPAIDFLMQSIDLEPQDLDRIVVAEGPGSYTGLRVAVATAKMLAYTLKIDLVGVSSLYALTNGFSENDLLVPLIDARRNNVYVVSIKMVILLNQTVTLLLKKSYKRWGIKPMFILSERLQHFLIRLRKPYHMLKLQKLYLVQ
ncbi:protein of unknown function [Streptococcus agalactiae COH1]|nr:protein of unknown function [Streptococcus agalactiae COH1]